MASGRVEGGRAASERPPLAEALTSGSCRNWDREASGGWLYTRMTLAVPKSRRANEKLKTKSNFRLRNEKAFRFSRFSAKNERCFRYESKTKPQRKQN